MASFNSASEAATAAIKIQEACNAANEFKLRIGIHLGDVVFENDDVFGDGVNIAARIQAQAPIGGIWVSEPVHYNLVNKNEISSEFVKAIELKNVKEPVRIYEIILKSSPDSVNEIPSERAQGEKKAGLKKPFLILAALLLLLVIGYWVIKGIPKGAAKYSESMDSVIDKSIAVLPFVDMSPGKDQEYFSDGLSEELLNLLSKTPELKVVGRTSSFSFKGKNEDLRMIGEKLGVAHILEGSVQKENNTIRVTAQLIRSADGFHLWSERYERNLEGIFKLQDEIAVAVVRQLKLKLITKANHATSSPINIELYNLILQGNYFSDRRDKENLNKALDFYLKALALDSTNARSWAAVAKCYELQSNWFWTDRKVGIQKAKQASIKSIELDDSQAEGHDVLGKLKMYNDFDWMGAESEFQKALSLDPGNTDVLRDIGTLYQILGRFDEAFQFYNQSLTLDPLKPITYLSIGRLLHYVNKPEEAIVSYKKALELYPQFPRIHSYLGFVYLLQGKLEFALSEMSQETDEAWRNFGLILTYHSLGRKKEADLLISDYLLRFQNDHTIRIAETYSFFGDIDKAFEWLEKSYLLKNGHLINLKCDPFLKNLERDPRHTALLKKMNLPVE